MIRWWTAQSRGRRIVLLVLGVILAVNVGIAALGSIVDQDPGGPPSAPRTTDGSGLAAYVRLLRDRGHTVEVIGDDLAPGSLPPEATVFLVDPVRFGPDDGPVLAEFLESGGRLILAGPATADLLPARTGADTVPASGPSGLRPEVTKPDELTGSARELTGDSGTRWRQIGRFEPLVGPADRPFLIAGEVERGRLVALADAGPLRNRNLAQAHNAALGVALAGDRPVIILDRTTQERSTGLAAIPTGWRWTAAALSVAGAFLLWSAGTRFGPPEPTERELRPARRDHVDAVAAGIARQRPDPATAIERIRQRERQALVDELRVDPTASDPVLADEAERLGLDADRITALIEPVPNADRALRLGRIAARRARIRHRVPTVPDPDPISTNQPPGGRT